MKEKIKNKKNEILSKKFNKNLKAGYDAYEVDKFFDTVNIFLDYIENEYLSLENTANKLFHDKKELIEIINKRERKILMQEKEINDLKDNGYQNQKIIKDISSIQNNLDKIRNGDK